MMRWSSDKFMIYNGEILLKYQADSGVLVFWETSRVGDFTTHGDLIGEKNGEGFKKQTCWDMMAVSGYMMVYPAVI